MRYEIVQGDTEKTLERIVNEAIKRGAEPIGGPTALANVRDHSLRYTTVVTWTQAVIYRED